MRCLLIVCCTAVLWLFCWFGCLDIKFSLDRCLVCCLLLDYALLCWFICGFIYCGILRWFNLWFIGWCACLNTVCLGVCWGALCCVWLLYLLDYLRLFNYLRLVGVSRFLTLCLCIRLILIVWFVWLAVVYRLGMILFEGVWFVV